ncbi:hypothetical protein V2S66_30355 [Streptomyces sp. V4-01]|uniref:Uncharacterized protein n=1 Tax=Actinacidiphila polyblastidii TaxID=3110430 RepID=A0ABU7PKA3_9ACTN|nr:hypothetical protein [Streptomyces sp. V4-01]
MSDQDDLAFPGDGRSSDASGERPSLADQVNQQPDMPPPRDDWDSAWDDVPAHAWAEANPGSGRSDKEDGRELLDYPDPTEDEIDAEHSSTDSTPTEEDLENARKAEARGYARELMGNDHSWPKHSEEFPGMTPQQVEDHLTDVLESPDACEPLRTTNRGEGTKYWKYHGDPDDPGRGTFISRDAGGGTFFVPKEGKGYYDRQ